MAQSTHPYIVTRANVIGMYFLALLAYFVAGSLYVPGNPTPQGNQVVEFIYVFSSVAFVVLVIADWVFGVIFALRMRSILWSIVAIFLPAAGGCACALYSIWKDQLLKRKHK